MRARRTLQQYARLRDCANFDWHVRRWKAFDQAAWDGNCPTFDRYMRDGEALSKDARLRNRTDDRGVRSRLAFQQQAGFRNSANFEKEKWKKRTELA